MIRLFRSLATTAFMTSLSRLLGYARDAVVFIFISNAHGALDAFFVAFRIPNFLRRLSAEGAFSQAFVPVFVEYREQKPQELNSLIDATAGALATVLILITALGILAAPLLIMIFAPGFAMDGDPRADVAGDLLRITFPYVLFISLTAMAGSMFNALGRFALPAITPALLNLSLIAAVLWLAPKLEQPVYALAWGVFGAGVLQLAIQLPWLHRQGLLPRPRLDWHHPGFRRIAKLMLPALFGSSVVQINLLFDTLVASFLAVGSISWLYLSDRFVELPLALFGISTATVLLPRLSECSARSDGEGFQAGLEWGVRVGLAVALPSAVGLALLAEPILATLLQYREFSMFDTRMAGLALTAFALGLPAFILVKVFAPGFFAHQDTRTPVRIGVIAMLANMALTGIGLLVWFTADLEGPHVALALATAIAAYLNAGLLYRKLRVQSFYFGSRATMVLLVRVSLACVAMTAVLWPLIPETLEWTRLEFAGRLLQLVELVILGAVVYAAVLWVLGTRIRDFRIQFLSGKTAA